MYNYKILRNVVCYQCGSNTDLKEIARNRVAIICIECLNTLDLKNEAIEKLKEAWELINSVRIDATLENTSFYSQEFNLSVIEEKLTEVIAEVEK